MMIEKLLKKDGETIYEEVWDTENKTIDICVHISTREQLGKFKKEVASIPKKGFLPTEEMRRLNNEFQKEGNQEKLVTNSKEVDDMDWLSDLPLIILKNDGVK